jgi:uncharacterized protein YutE (UPF0331/DUF86 family)
MKLNGVVQRKLALLDQYVAKLELYLGGKSLEAFKGDDMLQSATERVLQMSIEVMIDIAERLIALKGAGPVATASEAIERLVMLGILKSAMPYSDMVRFRNRIVHEYETTDPAILYSIAVDHRADFRRFRDEIDETC